MTNLSPPADESSEAPGADGKTGADNASEPPAPLFERMADAAIPPEGRFAGLLAKSEQYQQLADENYTRVRTLAEALAAGLCRYLQAGELECVHLVPFKGPFEPKPYGDKAFSVAPEGFRPLGAISFGLAVRVTLEKDWLRIVVHCVTRGDRFIVDIKNGGRFEMELPLEDDAAKDLYAHLHTHVLTWFDRRIDRYEAGDYSGQRTIGFDFVDPPEDVLNDPAVQGGATEADTPRPLAAEADQP